MYVYHLELFLTVQILEHTPAVLSLGKIFQEHGYTCERASGHKPHLTKIGKIILCKTENVVLVVVPELSSSLSASSTSTSLPQDSSSTSPSPARLRSDEALYLDSLPIRPKLRNLQANQDYEGSLQKAHWRSSTSSRKVWRLVNSGSQNPQRGR